MIPRLILKLPQDGLKIFIKTLIKNKLFQGESLDTFEKEFGKYIGSKHTILVPSARIGLYLILKSLNIKNGDEIILSAYNTPIVPNIISAFRAKPIFIDIDPDTFNINHKGVEKKISKKTKAIIVTHIEGQSCELNKIRTLAKKYGIKIIEDCAHACGASFKGKKVGSFGVAGFFSFGLGKHINTLGGGAITTNNPRIAKFCSSIMSKANDQKIFHIAKKLVLSKLISKSIYLLTMPILYLSTYFKKDFLTLIFEDKGTFNLKILKNNIKKFSNFQAILGLKQISYLNENIGHRRKNASVLNLNLNKKIKRQVINNFKEGAFLNYTIRVKNRNKVMRKMLVKGIDSQPTWMCACPDCKELNNYPESQKLEKEALYIPIYPYLKEKNMLFISRILNSIIKNETHK